MIKDKKEQIKKEEKTLMTETKEEEVTEEVAKEMKAIESGKYLEAVGRRKTSTARVRVSAASKESYIINDKEAKKYFADDELLKIIKEPLVKLKLGAKFAIEVKVSGGGYHSQAEAIRHGLARVLVNHDLELRTRIKKLGFLKRDPRMKERRKFGLKKARKAPQWSKR